MPAASLPTSSAFCLCSRSASMSLRSVMSAATPTVRADRPPPLAGTGTPRSSIQRPDLSGRGNGEPAFFDPAHRFVGALDSVFDLIGCARVQFAPSFKNSLPVLLHDGLRPYTLL